MYQPELGSESMDLHTGAMPGDKAVPDGRMEWWMEVTLMRGRQRVCQGGISDGKKDGRNRGGFLYSNRRSTAAKGAVRCQLGRWKEGKRCSCNRGTGRRPRGWWRGDGEGNAIQTLKTTDESNRGRCFSECKTKTRC